MSLSTEMELDAISELLNMGMGSAAASLSEMVGEEVRLGVPLVQWLAPGEAAQLLAREEGGTVAGVLMRFDGSIAGEALLVFPEASSLSLVRALMRDDVPLADLTDMEEEALVEVGNIILNGSLSSLADVLGEPIQTHVPSFVRGRWADLLPDRSDSGPDENPPSLLGVQIEFGVHELDLSGSVALMLGMQSMQHLRSIIETFFTADAT